jgi:preprotein translocase subunit SecG
MQNLLDRIMKPGVFFVLALLLGVVSVLLGLEAMDVADAGLCVALGVLSAAFLIGAVLLHVHHRPR